jgi:hypothetical protein
MVRGRSLSVGKDSYLHEQIHARLLAIMVDRPSLLYLESISRSHYSNARYKLG